MTVARASESSFGAWLRERRQALNLTQDELGVQVGYTGDMIRKMEAGQRRPSSHVAQALAERLAVAAEDREAFVRFARGMVAEAPLPAVSRGRGAEVRLPGSLPVLPVELIGREHELAQLRGLLLAPKPRLITLSGPPGIGKTSLALAAAEQAQYEFPHGAHFVPLAALRDPALVTTAIARTLGVGAERGRPLVEALHDHLWTKHLLLVLDNFEQIIAAAPLVGELLQLAPKLKVLVTSRASLRLRGEKEIAVAPLELPAPGNLPWLARLEQSPAVRLFVERASDARSDFNLNAANAEVVAELTRRLEGLPLAIELAAARVRLLPPLAILERLTNRLDLLSAGPADLPQRQQTLRNAISWSYDLLAPVEQVVFRRLGAFAGSCTLEAVEAVCAAEQQSGPVLNTLETLARVSLLRVEQHDGPLRFSMLETIREFALEKLAASDELPATRAAHAAYFLTFAERAETELRRPDQELWLSRLESEHDNLRLALRWALDERQAEIAVRLSAALSGFWRVHGHAAEGRRWVEQALQQLEQFDAASESGAVSPTGTAHQILLANTLHAAGSLTSIQGDVAAALHYHSRALTLRRELDDTRALGDTLAALASLALDRGEHDQAQRLLDERLALDLALDDRSRLATAYLTLGLAAQHQSDYPRARLLYEQSLALSRELNDKLGMAMGLHNLGYVLCQVREYSAARQAHEESLAIKRTLGNKPGIARGLTSLAEVLAAEGDVAAAVALLEEGVALAREIGARPRLAISLSNLGAVLLNAKDYVPAGQYLREALALNWEIRSIVWVVFNLNLLGSVAVAQNHARHAARLFAAAISLREKTNIPHWGPDAPVYERNIADGRAAIGEANWQAAWDEGRALPLEQVVQEALRN